MAENRDRRTGWIADIKVGDKIAIECSSSSHSCYDKTYWCRIETVEKITITGRIKVFLNRGTINPRKVWFESDGSCKEMGFGMKLIPYGSEVIYSIREFRRIHRMAKVYDLIEDAARKLPVNERYDFLMDFKEAEGDLIKIVAFLKEKGIAF